MLPHIPSFLPIEMLLQTFIYKILTHSYCITIVSEKVLNFSTNGSFIYISPNGNESLENQLLNVTEMGCSDYVVCLQDPKTFMIAFDKVIHIGLVRRSDRKIIFLPYKHNYRAKLKLLEVLKLSQTRYVPNLLLTLPSKKLANCSSYDLVTHNYVGSDNESNLPHFMDKWNSCSLEFENNVNLFPHNMSNLKGKTFNVAIYTFKPYTILLDNSTILQNHDGTEVRLVDEFCRWINCTIKLIRDYDSDWGDIFEDETGVGVVGNVYMDRADIGICGILALTKVYTYLDYSMAVVRTAITCLAPSPRLLPRWKVPLKPFHWLMWTVLFITFIYASIALIIAQGCSSDKVLLGTFGMMLSQSLPSVGTTWRIRSITGWMLITGLLIDNAYGGGLASVYMVPEYEKTIDTAQDILDRKMEWGGTNNNWIFTLVNTTEPLVKKLVRLFRIFPPEVLIEKIVNGTIALPLERLPSGNFAIEDYITKEAVLESTIMKEDLFYQYSMTVLRKNSPYTDKLNQFIGRLHETGLLLIWETQVVMKHLNYEIQVKVRLSRNNKNEDTLGPLSIHHVYGIFILYFFGVIASVLLLSLEVIVERRKAKIDKRK